MVESVGLLGDGVWRGSPAPTMLQNQWGPVTEQISSVGSNKATHHMVYYLFPFHLISLPISLLWQADDVVQGRVQTHRRKAAWQRPSGIPSLFRATPQTLRTKPVCHGTEWYKKWDAYIGKQEQCYIGTTNYNNSSLQIIWCFLHATSPYPWH